PFAVAGNERDAALAVANAAHPLVRIAPYRIRKIGVVSTLLPGLAGKVIEKTLKVTEERLAPARASIVAERRGGAAPRRPPGRGPRWRARSRTCSGRARSSSSCPGRPPSPTGAT